MIIQKLKMAIVLVVVTSCNSITTNEKGMPNIIIIYTDDVGYGDLGCYGATKVKTPNIDKLAKEGRTFTDAHSPSAVCTPSRYGLLTGQYAWRNNQFGLLEYDLL